MKLEIEDLSFNARLAMKFTNCSVEDAPMIANIMSDDVFHSTLDWQTEAELRRGAREAQQLLEENRADYEALRDYGRRVFEEGMARSEAEAKAKASKAEIKPEPQPLSPINDFLKQDRAEVEQRELAVAEREAAVTERELAVAKREAEVSP